MDQPPPETGASSDVPSPGSSRTPALSRKRSSSGAGGLLSKIPFMRSSGEHSPRSRRNTNESEAAVPMAALPPTPSDTSITAEGSSGHVAAAASAPLPLPHILQHQTSYQPLQQKTRRRRGSLRKVALLGRGAQRERRESRALTIDTKSEVDGTTGAHVESRAEGTVPITSSLVPVGGRASAIGTLQNDGSDSSSVGLGISDLTPRPSMDSSASRSGRPSSDPDATPTAALAPKAVISTTSSRNAIADSSPTISYSTTDDEDALHMYRTNPSSSASRPITPSISLSSSSASLLRPERASLSSGSESYFHGSSHSHSPPRPLGSASGPGTLPSMQRRRGTIQRAKSPLALTSYAGLSTTPLPPPDADWDYSETEWWGWIILVVTWAVFVIGMGSCLGVWSWAWDVGTTPYAPPELEDDPTLPIVGYYPALMILTGVMAWVWVVVAWVGMKYFRHAQVSGD
ncbi:hypothetical protein VTK56DRAFT_641 [Thermocarpiscus australiensis]